MKLIDNYMNNGSGWVIENIEFLRVDFSKYKPFSGGSYIELDERIKNKKCCINPKNEDEQCFKWCVIVGKYLDEIKHHPERVNNLKKYEDKIDWSMLEYPVNNDMISEFEKANDIPINIYELNDNKEDIDIKIIYNHKIISNNKIINLLLIENEEKSHYVYIKSLSGLIRSGTHTLIPCDKCL